MIASSLPLQSTVIRLHSRRIPQTASRFPKHARRFDTAQPRPSADHEVPVQSVNSPFTLNLETSLTFFSIAT